MESSIRFYSLPFSQLRTYVAALLFIVGNIALPQLFHLAPQGGVTWLPIYFFTLVGAYKYGWKVGLLTAVAAIISIGRFNSASSADEPLINTFGACFVGGVSAYGGVGTVSGVVAGAVFMMLFNNGMSIMGVPTNWQRVIQGLVLLFVLAMDIVLKKRSGRQN